MNSPNKIVKLRIVAKNKDNWAIFGNTIPKVWNEKKKKKKRKKQKWAPQVLDVQSLQANIFFFHI